MSKYQVGRGPFEFDVHVGTLLIHRDGDIITMVPAEAQSLVDAVSYARQMIACSVVPEKTLHGTWHVFYQEDKSCLVGRVDGATLIEFNSGTADALVQTIKLAVDKLTDSISIRGGAEAGVNPVIVPDPIVEGGNA